MDEVGGEGGLLLLEGHLLLVGVGEGDALQRGAHLLGGRHAVRLDHGQAQGGLPLNRAVVAGHKLGGVGWGAEGGQWGQGMGGEMDGKGN